MRYRYTTRMGFDSTRCDCRRTRMAENAAESGEFDYELDDDAKKAMLKRPRQLKALTVHPKPIRVKRFSLEGLVCGCLCSTW